jgi:hypothetical protein
MLPSAETCAVENIPSPVAITLTVFASRRLTVATMPKSHSRNVYPISSNTRDHAAFPAGIPSVSPYRSHGEKPPTASTRSTTNDITTTDMKTAAATNRSHDPKTTRVIDEVHTILPASEWTTAVRGNGDVVASVRTANTTSNTEIAFRNVDRVDLFRTPTNRARGRTAFVAIAAVRLN